MFVPTGLGRQCTVNRRFPSGALLRTAGPLILSDIVRLRHRSFRPFRARRCVISTVGFRRSGSTLDYIPTPLRGFPPALLVQLARREAPHGLCY